MHSVQQVTIALPDGSERELRFTLGARKRIAQTFGGMTIHSAIEKYDAGAFPGILHALMYDAAGNPSAFSIEWLEENLPGDASNEILAAIMSALSQGKAPKKEIEALLILAQKEQMNKKLQIGSNSGPSAPNASDSQAPNSGTESSSANSSQESVGGNAAEESAVNLQP